MDFQPMTDAKETSNHYPRSTKLISAALALMFTVSIFLLVRVPDNIKGYIYGLFREIARGQMLIRTHSWQHIEDDRFIIRHQGDQETALLVLETSRLFYEAICNDFSYTPKNKIFVVIYPSREELNASFNWPASENAMGVYWGGVIRVLAPVAWVRENDPEVVREIFEQAGPMAHEMTHLILDYVARGNYPRWFTEGVAQYQELKITGFMFDHKEGFWERGLYPLTKMDRNFDSLPDQSLAYRQSLSAIEYIVSVYGEEGLHNIIKNLSQGVNFNDSMQLALGMGLEQFEKSWHQWLAAKS